MTTKNAPRAPFQAIGIVGCGLIGCSIAAALKQRGFRGRIVGCGRPGTNLETALARGYVDAAETDLSKTVRSCDLVVVCTPVDRIVDDVRQAASACSKGTLITDAGSVKHSICGSLASGIPPGVTFIGSHPIAGSERQGCTHASPDLFVHHVCVLTPEPTAPRTEIDRLSVFWRLLGMTVVEMSAEAHDRALAQTSHVPHIVASSLAASLEPENRHLAAGGFLDTTRIASGDPKLWTAILSANSRDVAAGIRAVTERLNVFLGALEAGDEKTLAALLQFAKKNRDVAAPALVTAASSPSTTRPSDSTGPP